VVPVSIPTHFCIPEFPVGFRATEATRATVPETSVDKNSQTAFPKKEIRFAENILVPAPASDAVLAE
jgi:hypothetical protein